MFLRRPASFFRKALCALLIVSALPSAFAFGESGLFPENPPAVFAPGLVHPPAAGQQEQPAPAGSASRTQVVQKDVQAVVVRVIDGDSLVVNIPSFPPIVGCGITVRLSGCDTPELRDRRPEVRMLARRARALTAGMAPAGSLVWLRGVRRDKYFRLLAHVETACGDIGETLVRHGLAVPYSGGGKITW